MAKVGRMSEEFQEYMQKEIFPLVKNYRPKNNKEGWYVQWKLIPAQKTDPHTYINLLLKIREDPTVTWQFKTFLLQLVSIINTRFS